MSQDGPGQSSSGEENGGGPVRVRPKLSAQAAREVRRDTQLRRARTCYGHLAGVAGVQLMVQQLSRGWLEEILGLPDERRVRYGLAGAGVQAFVALGVRLPQPRNSPKNWRAAFDCLDWTERNQHLGGGLGRALAVSLEARGFIARSPETREVV